MELTIEQTLQQAVAAHKEGKLQEAERLYRAILDVQPKHHEANHNLGLIAVSMDQSGVALPLFKSAIDVNPNIEQFWLSYIEALIAERKFENAKQVLEQGKKQGVAGEKLNALEAQLASINQTENVDMASPSQTQLSSLFEHYQNGRYDDAEKMALLITQEFPKNQFSWKVLGALLEQKGMKAEALNANQKAVQLVPHDAQAHSNLGNTQKELGRLDWAEASYRQAIALKADFAEAHYNLGITLQKLGRLEEAEASCGQAIALKPDFAEAKLQKSMLLLNRQEFQLGWSLYDPPRDLKCVATGAYFTERTEQWKGSSLRGKNIQVYAAQGVGDEIMYSSCIPDLIQESPNTIYLECDPRLQPLFSRSFPEVTVYGRTRTRRLSKTCNNTDISNEDVHFDYSIPIDGLPRFFRNKIEDFPNRDAFLVPDPESVDKWEKRLADLGEGLKIGISWLGGVPKVHKKCSIPLSRWKNLLSVDAFFVNLQYGNTSIEVSQFSAENDIKIYDWEDNDALLDLDNQAALISKLDLVISIDNTTVHSCIALGTEVWNLIDLSLNLMFMENGTGISPLSRHLRFFKKKNQDSWDTVLSDAEQQLRERINAQ